MGLLVHNQQPWLCGSPDGLFSTGEGTVLLEIKCPHSIKDSAVIDSTAEVTFVKYLVYEEGRLCLRRTHKYFTQVQVLMYVLNLGECFFFCVHECRQCNCCCGERQHFLGDSHPALGRLLFLSLLASNC